MTVLFIHGCAAPGADGVGDYSRRLAAALQRHGCTAVLAATHDRVSEPVREQQTAGGGEVTAVRLPAAWPDAARLGALRELLAEFDPDWVSLQYVPYSFHPKGLAFGFTGRLARLLAPRRTHVMFHECWVGISRVSPLRHRLTGRLQAGLARRMVRRMRPDWVTTSNPLYRRVLADGGIAADLLPLFSNIPVATPNQVGSWPLADRRAEALVVGVFGSIYPEVDLAGELERLGERAAATGRGLLLVAFGRSGADGAARLDALAERFGPGLEILRLGELSAVQVSAVLQRLDVAISCTPRQHLGKSGVFAALRLHGVEVIANVDTPLPEYGDLIAAATEELFARPADHWSVDWVTERKLNVLRAPAS